jgi:hypothetical protein
MISIPSGLAHVPDFQSVAEIWEQQQVVAESLVEQQQVADECLVEQQQSVADECLVEQQQVVVEHLLLLPATSDFVVVCFDT